MDTIKRDKLIDCLYRRCSVRTATSREVFDGLVSDLGLIGTQHIAERALEIIRPYKNTGTNLESTVDTLYHVFYPEKKDEKANVSDIWNTHEP
jgi:hypothetical protein